MTVALQKVDLSADKAKLISRWLSAAGQDDTDLVNALKQRVGVQPGQATAYDALPWCSHSLKKCDNRATRRPVSGSLCRHLPIAQPVTR